MDYGKIVVAADKAALFADTAKVIADAASAAIARSGRFAFVLTGGSTPKSLYELLASDKWQEKIDWSRYICSGR